MNIDLKNIFTLFLNDSVINTLEKGQLFLKQYRNVKCNNYTLSESRILLMSLLLYRFKEEMETGPLFINDVRSVILAVLRNDDNKNVHCYRSR